jgi:uncharacterized protein
MGIPRIVIDTNVYVSATTIHQASPPGQILEAWRQKQIEVAISEPLLDELTRTLEKPNIQKFTGFTSKDQLKYLRSIHSKALIVSGTTTVDISPDPDDNALFSCAIEANADFIVSGDTKHVLVIPEFQGIRMISPRDFIDEVISKAA